MHSNQPTFRGKDFTTKKEGDPTYEFGASEREAMVDGVGEVVERALRGLLRLLGTPIPKSQYPSVPHYPNIGTPLPEYRYPEVGTANRPQA